MAQLPQVDTAKLGDGIANLARSGISNFANESFGNLDTLNEGAKTFGVTGLDSIIAKIKNFFEGILTKLGIHSSSAETPVVAAAATTPTTPSNPDAAKAAAAAAAAGNRAVGGTQVAAAGAPPATPASPAHPRTVG